MTADSQRDHSDAARWWTTSITRIEPGLIELRGEPIAELIGDRGLSDVIWLMLRGGRPTPVQARLLEAAMVASVDHGPQAPSIAIARMAITCGVGLNNAVASGINVLGDIHGGAGEQCARLLSEVVEEAAGGTGVDEATRTVVHRWRRSVRYLPGFGHRFHPVDPRRAPLISLLEEARELGEIPGHHLRAGLAVESELTRTSSRHVPMNIDCLTAIVYSELGFPPPLARGLFVLSRAVGTLAHAWEESRSGRRIKGPIPPDELPAYEPPSETV